MKVLIFGNIGAGKTTIAKDLLKEYPEFEYLAIDDFRKKYADGTMNKENKAKKLFINSIKESCNQIIEAMGFGDTGVKIADLLKTSNEKKLIIYLKTPLEICKKNLLKREWTIPYPASPSKAFELADYTQELIENNELYLIWQNTINTEIIELSIKNQKNMERIYQNIKPVTRLKQYSIIQELSNIILETDDVRGAVLIGSFGRKKPTYNSDIDILLLTNNNFNKNTFSDKLKSIFSNTLISHYSKLRNKLVIYFNDIPKLEFSIYNNISDCDKLFLGSEISSLDDIILKDSDKIIQKHLISLLSKNKTAFSNYNDLFKDTVDKFIYDFENYSTWHRRSNTYKAYFNFNLALNSCFQLLKIYKHDISHLYLPDIQPYFKGKEATDKFKLLNGTLYLPEQNIKKRELLDLFYKVIEESKYCEKDYINKVKAFCEKVYQRDFIYNFRDISDHCNTIKKGLIYRTSTLTRYQDNNYFNVYKDEFKIKTIIDLRADREILKSEYTSDSKAKFNIIWTPFDPWNQSEYFKQNYCFGSDSEISYRFFAIECKKSIKKVIETIIDENNHPIAIHCHAGKDRTGVLIALLYLSVGADISEVYNDYFASEADTKEYKLNSFLEQIKKFDSITDYLLSCKLEKSQIYKLNKVLKYDK